MLDCMEFDKSKPTPIPKIKTAEPEGQSEYRYWLTRIWDENYPILGFIGVNPSTASNFQDDRTTNNCASLANKFGFGGIVLVNLFAIRSKYPDIIRTHPNPIGSENNEYFQRFSEEVDCMVAAWGEKDEKYSLRTNEVLDIVGHDIYAMYLTNKGYPKHLSRYKMDAIDPIRYSVH